MKKKNVTMTISEDVIARAKCFGINASQAAELGIATEIRKKQEQLWLQENKGAIEAYNERVQQDGPLIKPLWVD